MKVTIDNYTDLKDQYGVPKEVVIKGQGEVGWDEIDSLITGAIWLKEQNPQIVFVDDIKLMLKVGLDLYQDFVDQKIEASKIAAAPVQPVAKTKAPKKPVVAKPAKMPKQKVVATKIKLKGRSVATINVAVRIIQAFVDFVEQGKVLLTDVSKLSKQLKTAIIERRITKKSKYGEEILAIQSYLDDINKKAVGKYVSVDLDQSAKSKLMAIAESQRVAESVSILKDYLELTNSGVASVDSIQKLIGRCNVALGERRLMSKRDRLRPYVEKLHQLLEQALKNKTKSTVPLQLQLTGLDKLPELKMATKKTTTINGSKASASEMANLSYTIQHLPDPYKKLLGPIATTAKMLLSCPPGQGKTFLALDLAAILSDLGRKVLFVSAEEYAGPTLADKLRKLGIPKRGAGITFSESLKDFNESYDFVVVDSVQKARLTVEEFNRFAKSGAGRNTGMLLIAQVTKEGKSRGSNEWPHDVDVVITIENGHGITTKNRYSNLATVKIRK